MCIIAEKLENRGLERGMEVLVLDNLEEGKTEAQILEKLMRRFSLSRERAEDCFKKYSR